MLIAFEIRSFMQLLGKFLAGQAKSGRRSQAIRDADAWVTDAHLAWLLRP